MNQLVILTKWLIFQSLIQKIPGRKETAMAVTTTRENKKDQSVRKILNAALLVFATQGYNGHWYAYPEPSYPAGEKPNYGGTGLTRKPIGQQGL